MKQLVKFLPLALLIACGTSSTKNSDIEALVSKRDSLQKSQLNIEKEINTLNADIAKLDTSNTTDELKLIKKIAIQRNKIVNMSKKLRSLENDLDALHKESHLIPVAVKDMKPEPFNDYIIVYGNVESDKYALISPEMNGRIDNILVSEGQSVSKGQLLVSLNTDAVDEQIKGTKSALELAKTTYEKQKALWDQNIGSEIQYLNAKNAVEALEAQQETLEAQIRMAQIRAPFNGVVNKVYSKKGEMASPAMPVIEFVSLGKMTIKADVSERYIDEIKEGQELELSFSSLPDFHEKVPIIRVSQVINPSSRTFEIEVQTDNLKERIKPNMVSTLKINIFSANDAFVVPSLAIRKDINGKYVYVANEKNGQTIVAKRTIETNRSYADKTMVSEGLHPDDKVIVKGFHLVSNGMPVTIVQ